MHPDGSEIDNKYHHCTKCEVEWYGTESNCWNCATECIGSTHRTYVMLGEYLCVFPPDGENWLFL